MILYCDTSALIKRYVEEQGTEIVDKTWSEALAVATSVAAFAETVAAFSRKHREGVLTEKEYANIVKAFKADFGSFILIPITTELNTAIERLVKRHSLRGFDAIHLASALVFKDSGKTPVQFACFDRNLNDAAAKEGLAVTAKI